MWLGLAYTAAGLLRWVGIALMSSTQLPLVLAITALATSAGRMSPAIADDLVGGAVLSLLIFPILAPRMRRPRPNPATSTSLSMRELSAA
ncbi:MAG TPA: hypothetical protein VMA77_14645 [Solirubrobacteraceae bacterium]|nr:hypothetical protein [Solirubrobacteraceae bacterium]